MNDTMDDQGIPAPEGPADIIETDYEIGQDNIETKIGPFGLDIHNPVFLISGLTVIAFVFYALALPEQAGAAFTWLFDFATKTFDWYFVGAANIFVIFCLVLVVTPVGKVRLGGADATPDYGYPGWFAMLFAAGMGIGLMFFGVLEPVYHMAVSSPLGTPSPFAEDGSLIPENVEAAKTMGLAATIFHWGLHPWAIYAVMALALALFSYNKGLPLTVRSAFYPLLGERVWGWWGHIIDVIAVFATLFGLATSLGLGAQQVNAGFNHVFGLPINATAQVLIISGITAIALISVVRGLDGGVKLLSEINMGLAALLLVFVLIVGPTMLIFTDFFVGLGAYMKELLPLSNPVGREDTAFMQGWTSFYWAWWISWSPFVGMFIARVSRGRTVREFIICVLIIPSLVCVLWMAVFGGVAIDQVLSDPGGSAVQAQVIDSYNPPLSLFAMLEGLPLSSITSTIAVILVIVFFVTSSDSGSLVIDTITAGGKVDAPVPQRVFWAVFEGAVAIVLLLSSGGLKSLQSMVISTGLLFTLVLVVMCWSIWKGLKAESRI
ncbi:MAG: BCCT family transporter [Rhodobacteraceae bacterium]|jgi:BCCT family betaine/carnitine transporter|uniref:Betaine/carnitine transporter, BCCT family n=1 Tax=Salipiger profundus TaxID=1229727 RepID=A0A1U7DAC0_9RHOB|nr:MULTISPECIES: BCCT family transporter [Salipiger]APX25073.1 betaine/carnitine transporter, BCCT family [Salipiger profundus]MAB07580.1 BCCT family transporter [Paracoccaceae bacterium]GGA15187.1 BCCT family transporter [Salipiger profundus]SFD11439.1 betaine/carnitine transporter, BCCT family [Salipiger profundus]